MNTKAKNKGSSQTNDKSNNKKIGNIKKIFAPYNFVPLSDWVYIPSWHQQVSHDLPFKDGYSGEIVFEIEALTQLLVGEKHEPENKEKPAEIRPYRLPGDNETYAIPGSSLKGMLRTVIEIAAFGRMRMVDDQNLSVRDLTAGARDFYGKHMTKGNKFKGLKPRTHSGWLKYIPSEQQWVITPCSYARIDHSKLSSIARKDDKVWWEAMPRIPNAHEKYKKWNNSLHIKFTPEREKTHLHSEGKKLIYQKAVDIGHGKTTGTLVFTGQPNANIKGKSGTKHMEFVFYNKQQTKKHVSKKAWKGFSEIYQNSEDWAHWKSIHNRTGESIPVFFLYDNSGEIESLGLSQMYRLPYAMSIHEMVSNTSKSHIETSKEGEFFGYDLADLVFGYSDEQSKNAIKGRVSIETAVCTKTPNLDKPFTTVLSSPKPSYYPNYVTQETDGDINHIAGHKYATYTSTDEHSSLPTVRGHKRYPARPPELIHKQPPPEKSTSKSQVRLHPLSKGSTFKGRIIFHNLKPQELGALLWAITWGNNKELNHSLGMAKSMGFGQVIIRLQHSTSKLRRNNNPSITETLSEEKTTNLISSFTKMMEELHLKTNNSHWHDSPKITNLLAMANPKYANIAKSKGYLLHHMQIRNKNGKNDFVLAKQSKALLPDYAKLTRS